MTRCYGNHSGGQHHGEGEGAAATAAAAAAAEGEISIREGSGTENTSSQLTSSANTRERGGVFGLCETGYSSAVHVPTWHCVLCVHQVGGHHP